MPNLTYDLILEQCLCSDLSSSYLCEIEVYFPVLIKLLLINNLADYFIQIFYDIAICSD